MMQIAREKDQRELAQLRDEIKVNKTNSDLVQKSIQMYNQCRARA